MTGLSDTATVAMAVDYHSQETSMSTNAEPTKDTLGQMMITDVLERWPNTAAIFHNHAMACVGCAVASFYSISDAAVVYGLSPDRFVEELLEVVRDATTERDA